MTPEQPGLERFGRAWLDFWFAAPPAANLAWMRIGVGLIFLYVLLMRSYDLETLLSVGELGEAAGRQASGAMVPPFSIFDLFPGRGWLWTVHVAAITCGVAFLLGIFPTFTGLLALLFHLSYWQRSPAVWLGIDSLLTLSLALLVLLPTARVLAIPGLQFGRRRQEPLLAPNPRGEEDAPAPWSGIVLRLLQIHLCLLYFLSGLAKLNAEWLGGIALWHPRLVEKGTPLAAEILQGAPLLLVIVPAALVLFELFYGVLIWLRGLRHLTLFCAVLLHLAVGIFWEKLPFNFLMIALNLAFLKSAPLQFLCENLSLLGSHGWQKAFNRA